MKKMITFMGFKGSGKDTAAQAFQGYTKLAFADSIKDALAPIFGWDRKLLNGDTPESRQWRETVDPWWSVRLNMPDFTPRKAMTMVGTDILRKHLDDRLWINSLIKKMDDSLNQNFIITDVRHRIEIEFLSEYSGGFQAFFIDRSPLPKHWAVTSLPDDEFPYADKCRYMKEHYPDIHHSEWEWNTFARNSAVRIPNDSSKEDLLDQIKNYT